MVVMLGVLWLLVDLARDPKTWRWLDPTAGAPRQPADPATTQPASDEPHATGPTDTDSEELDAAREELQAVTDKAPLAKEEMPAYWRMMAWERRQSTANLLARAEKGVTFNELWQQPERWRGKLVEIPVHLRRTARVDEVTENSLGMKTVYEVWGWNSDSQPYWFWFVCSNLPPGMPSGASIYEEATFVGYFLKLLPYEDHQGKHLATPLLIGRLVWHPEQANPLVRQDEWTWPWLIALGLGGIFLLRWGLFFAGRKSAENRRRSDSGTLDAQAVETWLEQAETDVPGHESRDSHAPPDRPNLN